MTARTCVVSNRWSGPRGAPSTWNGCNPVSIKYSRNPEDARERDRGRGWGSTSNYDCRSTTPCTQLHAPCSDAVRTPYCTDHVRFGFALLVADHKETLSSTPPIAKHSPSGDHAQACACNNDDINTARVSITGRQQAAARERTLLGVGVFTPSALSSRFSVANGVVSTGRNVLDVDGAEPVAVARVPYPNCAIVGVTWQ